MRIRGPTGMRNSDLLFLLRWETSCLPLFLLWPLVVNDCYHLAIFRVAHRFKYCPSSKGLEESKIFGLFTEDTSQTLMGAILWLSILLSWLSKSALFGLLCGSVGGGVTRNILSLLVLPYGHGAFSPYFWKVTYRFMAGECVGDCSTGTDNVRHKSVYQL